MTANEGRDRDGATSSVRISSQIFVPNLRHVELEDLISSLPDEILQHILSFIPTKLAINTSILSRRWRHVWENTPTLSFDSFEVDFDSINKTLTRYTARKMMSFQLYIKTTEITYHDIDRLIKFAKSRGVENMWLNFDYYGFTEYKIPEFFYINSIVKHITVKYADMVPRCSVSWTALKTLSFHCFYLSDDESIAKILSGCPILESLTLSFSHQLKVLDLSKLLRLRKLEIDVLPKKAIDRLSVTRSSGLSKIVAPQIHFLRLTNPQLSCVLVDVSSLTEAKLEFCPLSLKKLKIENHLLIVFRMKKMIEKLQNVQKLTFGEGFLKILSLAEFYKLPFESLKVKVLTLETVISQYVIPGIVRLLQNSSELKKLTVHTMTRDTIPGEHLDKYFAMAGLYPETCWSSEAKVFGKIFTRNVEPNYVASFLELMLNSKTSKTLEKMVIKLEDYHLSNRGFQELLQMVSVLAHDNNVSIELNQP